MLKQFFFNVIAAIIMGSVVFVTFILLFDYDLKHGLIIGTTVAITGLIVEYLKPLWTEKKSR